MFLFLVGDKRYNLRGCDLSGVFISYVYCIFVIDVNIIYNYIFK